MYKDLLAESAAAAKTLLCIGLDPVLKHLPAELQGMGPAGIPVFFEIIFREMQERGLKAAAFKPNQGFYLIHDRPFEGRFDGSLALARTIELVRSYFPGIPLILDFKRGDIAGSSANYAEEGFDQWKADAVTVSPYMGADSVGPFLDHPKKGGTYILNRTSNPGSADLQASELACGHRLFQKTAKKILAWADGRPGTGAVVGATSLEELSLLAGIYAESALPLLIPGVGSQGGSAEEVCSVLKDAGYPLPMARINSSSGITHPWAKKKEAVPADWNHRVCDEIEKLNSAMEAFL